MTEYASPHHFSQAERWNLTDEVIVKKRSMKEEVRRELIDAARRSIAASSDVPRQQLDSTYHQEAYHPSLGETEVASETEVSK